MIPWNMVMIRFTVEGDKVLKATQKESFYCFMVPDIAITPLLFKENVRKGNCKCSLCVIYRGITVSGFFTVVFNIEQNDGCFGSK